MAKKKSKKVDINRTELYAQVIGYVEEKKNNIGRVLIIFIAFIIAVFYLPQLTVFINNMLGIHSAPTITDKGKDDGKNPVKPGGISSETKVTYHALVDGLEIDEGDFKLSEFIIGNNSLTFKVTNKTNGSIDLSKTNYFIETYSENKTLLERRKADFPTLSAGKSENITIDISNANINFIVLGRKERSDYPVLDLEKDELGFGYLTCKKGYQTMKYTFKNDELVEVNDEVIYNFMANDTSYTTNFNEYQQKITSYNNITGVSATFNSSPNGFTAAIKVDMGKVDMKELNERRYYTSKEEPKVVKFEMDTYGYTCS